MKETIGAEIDAAGYTFQKVFLIFFLTDVYII